MKRNALFTLLLSSLLLMPVFVSPKRILDQEAGDENESTDSTDDENRTMDGRALEGIAANAAQAALWKSADSGSKKSGNHETIKLAITDLKEEIAELEKSLKEKGITEEMLDARTLDLKTKQGELKKLRVALRRGVISDLNRSQSSISNFVTQSVTTSPWDEIRNVDFSEGTWPEVGTNVVQGLGRGVAIQTATSVGKRIGEGVDSAVDTLTIPFFSAIKDGFLRSYRVLFRKGLDPFDPHEITYWRDNVVSTLQLLVNSGRNLAEFEDRDRQQRQRDRIRGQDGETDDDGVDATTEDVGADFAERLTQRCVVAQLSRVAIYVHSRVSYYRRGRPGTHERQIIEAAEVIEKALMTVHDEIVERRSLKQLSTPEFKAVIPHYIIWIEECFNGLGRLISQDRKQAPTFISSLRSNSQFGLYN